MSRVPVLFDANGSVGKKSSGAPEFPDLRARLDYMNRFGIARALVWNVESQQNHAGASNHALLEQIQTTPGAQGRIIPAFSISGLMTYEEGGIKALEALMKASQTRSLRFANVFGRLTLRQLEPVIRGIRRQRPFIVMRYDQAAVEDIAEFAARFPEISLVLTEVMWGPCIMVFDLMRRRKNILVDNSWLHSCGAIELVVKHFGAERLVFGTGYKAHNGAAIGALAHADITDTQRRLIACGNLERLAGLRPVAPVPMRVPAGNTLWPAFLEGKPLKVETVDAHGHLGPSGGYVLDAQEEQKQVPLALKTMKRNGIGTMIVSSLPALMGGPVQGNDRLEALLRSRTDHFLGYVAFNPGYAGELVPRLDRYFAGPFFVGFKTLCDYWDVPITDHGFEPMWKYATRHRLPVLNHTWGGTNDTPAMFTDLAKRYPHVPFLLGHSGGGNVGRREAVDLARKHRNVILEWCGSFCCTIPWEETIRAVGPDRVVFGTDAMAHDINWELGRLLSLDMPDEVLVPILGRNMRRILAMRR